MTEGGYPPLCQITYGGALYRCMKEKQLSFLDILVYPKYEGNE